MRAVARYVWSAPTTAVGLLVLLAGLWRLRVRVVDGVLEAHGPALSWLLSHLTLVPGGATALTLGHVVMARDRWSHDATRAHERVHVRQCETWGPFFLPAYLAASVTAVLRGRHFYLDNRFEVEAFTLEAMPFQQPVGGPSQRLRANEYETRQCQGAPRMAPAATARENTNR